jgi:integral membrane sensor domain MASE1
MIRLFRSIPLMLAAFLLAACAQLGLATPETLPQRIAVTVSSVTAVRTSAATLLAAKKISVSDAENIQQQADSVVAGAAVARTLGPIDPAAADAKLQQARAVLVALSAYLASKETK